MKKKEFHSYENDENLKIKMIHLLTIFIYSKKSLNWEYCFLGSQLCGKKLIVVQINIGVFWIYI